MAKKTVKARTGKRPARSSAKSSTATKARRSSAGRVKRAPSRSSTGKAGESKSAADALIGLLQSPIVADVLAVGAAAALAALAQRGLSRRQGGSSKTALKNAAKAAATAMGTRIAEEIDEILKSSKASKSSKA